MTEINAETIQLVKQAAIEKINNLSEHEVGEEIRKFFAPNEPSPNLTKEQIEKLVNNWLGED